MTAPEKCRVPTATYRLQFNRGFTFRDAQDLVEYLDRLGISDVYSSPIFVAPPESNHGYDLCDYCALNPVLGSEQDFADLIESLKRRGMGYLLDFVPNHMGTDASLNPWWREVLKNGPASRYASFFDIDWNRDEPSLAGKILLPILGDHYGRVLERGELGLSFQEGEFWITYFATKLPVNQIGTGLILSELCCRAGEDTHPRLRSLLLEHARGSDSRSGAEMLETLRRLWDLTRADASMRKWVDRLLGEVQGRAGDAGSFDFLETVLDSQFYRLGFWKYANKRINYRRFFEISSLIGVRVEQDEVFEAVHRLVFEWVKKGWVTGLRLDHIDGLRDPEQYLHRLRSALGEQTGRAADSGMIPLYLVVEKILMEGEPLRAGWPVHGTTGYDFCIQVAGLLVDASAEARMTKIYRGFAVQNQPFEDLVYHKKKQVMGLALSSEVGWLGRILGQVAQQDRYGRDLQLEVLMEALREVMACFVVYRTYLRPDQQAGILDRKYVESALNKARERNPGLDPLVFDFVGRMLVPAEDDDLKRNQDRVEFMMRFQQFTGPIMAKGWEDTALFVYNRFSALNEVGGNPGGFGRQPEEFHRDNVTRMQQFPHGMLATSTHDTKVSEDVRARLAAICEVPGIWAEALKRWRELNAGFTQRVGGEIAPSGDEEYLFYQILLASWPNETLSGEEAGRYTARLQQYMRKAVNEAKVNSRWDEENASWHEAVAGFVAGVLSQKNVRFIEEFQRIARTVAELGAINSLSQLLLKMTVPGVPDFYQGTETWNLRLVDPDNRQPVDYGKRKHDLALLNKVGLLDLMNGWRSGLIKLFVTQTVLRFRRDHAQLFQEADYAPLDFQGELAECCFGFSRVRGAGSFTVIVPRLSGRIGFPPLGERWGDTRIAAQTMRGQGPFRDHFTGRSFEEGTIPLADLFSVLPVALLIPEPLWSAATSPRVAGDVGGSL